MVMNGNQMVSVLFPYAYRIPLVTVSDRKGFSSNVAILLLYSSLELKNIAKIILL